MIRQNAIQRLGRCCRSILEGVGYGFRSQVDRRLAIDIVSTVYNPELSRDMAMKIGNEYSSEKTMARDFEQLAEEAGLGKALVRRRVPDLADTVIPSLAKVEIARPIAEKVSALFRERREKAQGFREGKA